MGYQDTYAAMSDEVLMNVASDIASLEDAARVAITAELNRRHISDTDIGHYRQEVAAFNPKEFWGTHKYVARSFYGCGTMILGKPTLADAYRARTRSAMLAAGSLYMGLSPAITFSHRYPQCGRSRLSTSGCG